MRRVFRTREDCAWTEGGRWADLELDLSGYTGVEISASVFERVTFAGLQGHVGIGGSQRSRLEDCRFVNTRLRRLHLDNVDMERCEFIECAIGELWTDGADLVGCRFSGSLRRAIIRRTLPGERRELAQQPPHAPRFVDNDFGDCAFDEVEFRGGIDLRRQRLSDAQRARILYDVAARLEAVLARHPEATLTAAQLRRVEMLRRAATEYRQRDDYLSLRLTARDDAATQELMRWLAEVPVAADPPGYVWTPDDPVFAPVPPPEAEDTSDRAALLAAIANKMAAAQRFLGSATFEEYCADFARPASVAIQLGIAADAARKLRSTERAIYAQLPAVDKLVKLAKYFGPGATEAEHRRAYAFVTQHAAALVAAARGARE